MVKKAFAYVTRRLDDDTKQLLVFCSPSQHIEVPKGTVEAGEDLTLAVLRELHEESGIATARVIHKIGERTTWVHGGPDMNGPLEEQRHYAYELEDDASTSNPPLRGVTRQNGPRPGCGPAMPRPRQCANIEAK